MAKRKLTLAIISAGAVFFLTSPVRGDIFVTLSNSYDSPSGYDFVNTFPPAGSTTIGTFMFTIPTGEQVTGITISGTFGNGDSPTTALSDYFLGFSGHETAVPVANCDSISADCYSNGNGPTLWSDSLTSANLNTLASAIGGGALDFTYTWDNNTQVVGFDQFVYAGAPTIDIQVTPEPASVLLLFSVLAAIAALRRFRRV